MIEPGTIVRLKSPRHKDTLENEWYCRHWEALTPMVCLGFIKGGCGFARVMTPDSEVKTVWHGYLTTHMRRGYYGV